MLTRAGCTSAGTSSRRPSLFPPPRFHLPQLVLPFLLSLLLSPHVPLVSAGVARSSSVKRQLSNHHHLDVVLIPSAGGRDLKRIAEAADADPVLPENVPLKSDATSRQQERMSPGGANNSRAQFVPDIIADPSPAVAAPGAAPPGEEQPTSTQGHDGLPHDPAELMAVLALLQSLGMADETIGGMNALGPGGINTDSLPEGGGASSSVPEHLQFTTLEPHLGPAILPLQVPEGYFVPFLPRRAFGVENGVSRPAHGHASFYEHRPPGLVDVRNTPAYGFIFGGYRRFKSE